MNIDATEEDLRVAAEALKLSAILDDRAPKADKARVVAWAEKIHKFNLLRSDVLDGVQAFYDSPSERAIQTGDMVHHARYAKRGRLEKESDADLEARQAEQESKVEADDIRVLTADAIGERIKNRTDRLAAAEHGLQTCHGKRESAAALQEYFAARAEAKKPKKAKAS